MAQVVLYIAASIDGYIAREDGNLDWLMNMPNPDQTDHGYADFFKTIGACIMGRATYEEVLGFGIEWPYPEVDTYVLSRQENYLVSTPRTFSWNTSCKKLVSQLQTELEKDIWLVGGGKVVSAFLNEGLLDRIILTVVPLVLGKGIPLFPDGPKETNWKLEKTETFSTGAVTLTYQKI